MKMTHKEFVAKVAEKTEVAAEVVGAVVAGAVEVIGDAIVAKDNVSINDFGIFKVVERKARTGRNPKTGEPLDIKASTSVKLEVGKKLKEKLNAK